MERQNLVEILEDLNDKVQNMNVGSNEPNSKNADSNKTVDKDADKTGLDVNKTESDGEFSYYELIDYESGEEANGDEDEEVCKFLCGHAPKVRKALEEAAKAYGPIIWAQIAEDKAKKAEEKAAKLQLAEKERRARFPPEELAKRRRKNERDKERKKRRKAEIQAEAEREREERRRKKLQKIKERKVVEREESDIEFILE